MKQDMWISCWWLQRAGGGLLAFSQEFKGMALRRKSSSPTKTLRQSYRLPPYNVCYDLNARCSQVKETSMTVRLITLILISATAAGLCRAQATATAPATSAAISTKPTAVDEAIKPIMAVFATRPTSNEQAISVMRDVLKQGGELEKKFADAPDVYKIELPMLQAAAFLANRANDEDARKQVQPLADKILKSSAPAEEKLKADYFAIMLKFQGNSAGAGTSSQERTRLLDDLIARYENTPAAPNAAIMAVVVVVQSGAADLQDRYVELLRKKYPEEGKAILKLLGGGNEVGRPFQAELTKLDGSKIRLPDDFKGKAAVIYFWASWCPACRASMPDMKKTYEQYKDRNIVFVGVSLDRPNQAEQVKQFVKDNGMEWIQTYSGQAWDDPTAKAYDIDAIPTILVLGKDGKVFKKVMELGALAPALNEALASEPAQSAPAHSGGK